MTAAPRTAPATEAVPLTGGAAALVVIATATLLVGFGFHDRQRRSADHKGWSRFHLGWPRMGHHRLHPRLRWVAAAGPRRAADARTIRAFDFSANPDVDPATIHQLSTCDWVKKGQPLCLIGDSGTGKRHLLIAGAT
jgi:hypothetical protein